MNDWRSQLSPGWSGVNVALVVVLFLFAWPLGLVMIGYIVWGRRLGLDVGRPETLSAFGARLSHAWRAGSESWGSGRTIPSTGTPGARAAGGRPDAAADSPSANGRTAGDTTTSDETLRREREILARERQAFETEKREWRERRDGERRGEPLDS